MAALSKKNQKIIDRLRSSGYVGNNIQRDAPFKFLVRPFSTIGVDSLDMASGFENEIFSAINTSALESEITGIVIFPAIFDEQIGPAPKNYVKYKKDEKSVFVGLTIEFSTWSSASGKEKLQLLSNNIKRSIELIPDTYLLSPDRKRLIKFTNQAHERLLARLSH
jgi:hypothetical protein